MVRVAWTKALATIPRLKTGMVQGLGLQIWGFKEQEALIMLRFHSIEIGLQIGAPLFTQTPVQGKSETLKFLSLRSLDTSGLGLFI